MHLVCGEFVLIYKVASRRTQSSRTGDGEVNPLFNLRVLSYDPCFAFKAGWLDLKESL